MKKRVRKGGFTLPEVLVTVTVVAVLAAVVVPAVTQYVNRGNAPSTQGDVEQMTSAVTGYIADTRTYPGHFTDLTTDNGVTGWHGPYFSGNVTSGGTGVTGSQKAAFTSTGLNVIFADSIDVDHTSGWVSAYVAGASTCTSLFQLDSALDGKTDGSAGRVQYAGTCTDSVGDLTNRRALVHLASVGKS